MKTVNQSNVKRERKKEKNQKRIVQVRIAIITVCPCLSFVVDQMTLNHRFYPDRFGNFVDYNNKWSTTSTTSEMTFELKQTNMKLLSNRSCRHLRKPFSVRGVVK